MADTIYTSQTPTNNDSGGPTTRTVQMRFQISANNKVIRTARYWVSAAGLGSAPLFQIWNITSSTKLREIDLLTISPGPTGVGWFGFSIGTELPVVTGTNYSVGIFQPGADTHSYSSGNSLPVSSGGAVSADLAIWRENGTSNDPPVNAFPGGFYFSDVNVEDASTVVTGSAGLASGTGTAFNAQAAIATTAGLASGLGAAFGPTATVAAGAGVAVGAGTAFDAVAAITISAQAGVASAAGAAFGTTAIVAPNAGVAPALGTAYNVTGPTTINSMSTDFGPCEWPLVQCQSWPTGSEAITGNVVAAATEVLWAKTAQRYGVCEMTIRPCRKTCGEAWPFLDRWYEWSGGMWPRPLLYNGMWFNITCGSCPGTCSCTMLETVELPGPVNTITEVKINGVVLSSAAYTLRDNRLLIRTDGGQWPVCQDMSQPDTADNTFAVTFTWGEEVPVIGQQALGQLANALARECMGDDCRLPKNVTNLARQGITITLPEDWLRRYTFVDLFLGYANPKGLIGAPQIYDPDATRYMRGPA